VLVLPSVVEAFGLVLIEAMACELPVIAVDAHGPARIVAPGTGWLVPPDDEAALADALIAAANDREERRRRGASASLHARSQYGWQGVTKQVSRVYEEALSVVLPPHEA
jgi:glycosyltransferase involved in cell wall biosynthesis